MECERRRQGKLGAPSPAPVRGGPRAPRSWLRLCPSGLRDARRARPLRPLRRRVAVTPSTRHLVAGGGCRACVSPRPLWAAPRGLPVLSRLSVEVRRAPASSPKAGTFPVQPRSRSGQTPALCGPPRPPGRRPGPGDPPGFRVVETRAPQARPLPGVSPRSVRGPDGRAPGVVRAGHSRAHPFARGGRFGAPRGGRSVPRHRGCACVARVRVHFSPRGACALRLSSRIVPVCAPVAATPAGSALGPAGYGHAPSPCVSPRAEHAKHLFTRGSVWWSACPGPWLVEKLGSSVLTDSEQLLVWTAGESLAVGSRSVGRRFAFLMMLCDERVFLTVTRSSSSVILFVPD